MRLAICDDNELERRILHSLLKKYFSEASISCEFTLYDHGTTLYYRAPPSGAGQGQPHLLKGVYPKVRFSEFQKSGNRKEIRLRE